MSAKEFVSPLPAALLALLIMALLLWWRARSDRAARRIAALSTGLLLGLAVAALPVTADALAASLEMADAASTEHPAAVVVLGGGYDLGATASLDVLNETSTQRVLEGVSCWRRAPDALLVLAGAAPMRGRPNARLRAR